MNRKRMQREKLAHKNRKRKITVGLAALFFAVVFSIITNSNFVKAGNDSKNMDQECEKHYKSIALEYGDTLWDIALQNKDPHYESVNDYIDEVMKINHLKTDQIHAGRYLMVPYYIAGNCNKENKNNTEKTDKNTNKNPLISISSTK